MIQKLSTLKNDVDQKLNAISIHTEDISLDNFVTIAFPLLQEGNCQTEKMPDPSFFKDFPSKNQMPTKQDLSENSFIFDAEVSAIHLTDSLNNKVEVKNRLNKSVTSINDVKSLQAIFNNYGMKGKEIKQKVD